MGRDDTNPVRIIETEAGRLVGRVDRVERAVVWALTCPDCDHEIHLPERVFSGQEPARCVECAWTEPVENPLASDGAPRWHDFRDCFETAPPSKAAAA